MEFVLIKYSSSANKIIINYKNNILDEFLSRSCVGNWVDKGIIFHTAQIYQILSYYNIRVQCSIVLIQMLLNFAFTNTMQDYKIAIHIT